MNDPLPAATVGRIVRYVLPDGCAKGEARPGVIVRTFRDPALVSLRLWLDPDKDCDVYGDPIASWRSAVHYDDSAGPGTWHWER